jgi:hypothetical protein
MQYVFRERKNTVCFVFGLQPPAEEVEYTVHVRARDKPAERPTIHDYACDKRVLQPGAEPERNGHCCLCVHLKPVPIFTVCFV